MADRPLVDDLLDTIKHWRGRPEDLVLYLAPDEMVKLAVELDVDITSVAKKKGTLFGVPLVLKDRDAFFNLAQVVEDNGEGG